MREELLFSSTVVTLITMLSESSLERPYTSRDQKTLTRIIASVASALAVLKIVEFYKNKETEKKSKEEVEFLEQWNHISSPSFSESSSSHSISSLISY